MIVANKHFRSRLVTVIYSLMAFLLSFVLFALSYCIMLEATLFNPNFLTDNMNSSNYFVDKCDEITQNLVDLGHASGLNDDFFEGFLDELIINEDTCNYLDSYYSGESKLIDTTAFKQRFNEALDEYIKENKIENVNSESREYLVKNAALIYRNSLEIPLFSRLSAYFISIKNIMPFVISGLAAVGIIISLVIIFTNKWKHRAVKYICCSFSGAFLAVGVLPAVVFLSGKVRNINITSRALYNLFVQCANNVLMTLLVCSVIYFLTALTLYLLYRKMYKKASR